MPKILLKIFLFLFLFQGYIFNIQKDFYLINNYTFNQSKPGKILQTLYSDSPSNNYYYTVLYVSKNYTKLTYLIDTELDVMSSPCHRCYHCNRNKTIYFFGRGKVKRRIKCDSDICKILPSIGCIRPKDYVRNRQCSFLSTKINGNGMRGYFIKEYVYFQDDRLPINQTAKDVYTSHYIPIGCSLAEYGRYRNISVDGFMGLNNKDKSFISMLYNLRGIKKNIFSVCLGDGLGYLSIGNIINRYHKSHKIKYEKIKNNSINTFQLNTSKIIIQNTSRTIVNTQSVIDSVTPFSYFPQWIYNYAILYKIKIYFNKTGINFSKIFFETPNYGYCIHYNNIEEMNKEVLLWPVIYIIFSKVTFKWYPENYFYRANNNTACLGFKEHNFNHIIFGSNFMRGKDFIFNKKKEKIGFVEADCEKIIFKNYTDYINNTNITTNKNSKKPEIYREIISMVINGTEFIRGNFEVNHIRDYNLFYRIINILFFSSLSLVFSFFIIIVIILYKIYNNKVTVANIEEEHKKLSQSDYE